MLFGGLLLAFEVVGFEVPIVPFSGVNIKLQRPELLPVVLLALITYSAFRVAMEWLLLREFSRLQIPARLDFAAAHAIAAAGIVLFLYRTFWGTAVVANVTPALMVQALVSFIVGSGFGSLITGKKLNRELWERGRKLRGLVLLGFIGGFAMLAYSTYVAVSETIAAPLPLASAVFGFVIFLLIYPTYPTITKPHPSSSETPPPEA